jgi:hypothetical protein
VGLRGSSTPQPTQCQLTQRGIPFAAMDNGLRSCADLPAAQRTSNGLNPAKIDALFRKWLARLPHPYSAQDRRAGYRYDLSILQAEFSLTLRPLLAQWLQIPESDLRPGRMTYDLRRLRLHGLIKRLPHTQRYRLTTFGLKTALFYSRTYQRLLRPGLSQLHDPRCATSSVLTLAITRCQKTIDAYVTDKMAA